VTQVTCLVTKIACKRAKSQERQWQTDNSQIPTLHRNPPTLRV